MTHSTVFLAQTITFDLGTAVPWKETARQCGMGPLISGCAQSMVSRTATLASSERCRISDSTPDLRNDNLHINKTPGNLYALQSLRNMALDHSTIAGAQASAKEGPSYPLCSPAGDLEHLTHKCCQTDTSSYSGCLVIGDSLASFPFFFFFVFFPLTLATTRHKVWVETDIQGLRLKMGKFSWVLNWESKSTAIIPSISTALNGLHIWHLWSSEYQDGERGR